MPGAGACHSRTVMGRPASLTSGQGECGEQSMQALRRSRRQPVSSAVIPPKTRAASAADSNLAREAPPARCLESCLITLGP